MEELFLQNQFVFQLKAERERQEKREAIEEKVNSTVRSAKTTPKSVEAPAQPVFRSGIGKYISNQA